MARGLELKVKFQMPARFNRLEMTVLIPGSSPGTAMMAFVRHPAIFSTVKA
jgi:hypothetical protein